MNADAPAFVPTLSGSSLAAPPATKANTSPPRDNKAPAKKGGHIEHDSTASNKPTNSRQPRTKKKTDSERHKREPRKFPQHNNVQFRHENPRPSVGPQEQETESAIVKTDKKGRVSLNHLLNFSFPERQQPLYTARRHKQTTYQPYNKERFVNANFRFLVQPSGDYTLNLADPDASFDWNLIEQVLITATETPSCPICLSPPVAARVTKCGHIYCLPCMLHYLALRENTKKAWRKCPICWDAIYAKDLKSVRILTPFAASGQKTAEDDGHFDRPGDSFAQRLRPGDQIDMRLIQRDANSTLAFPLSDTWPLSQDMTDEYLGRDMALIPWQFMPGAIQFSRFMKASPEYIKGENSRDWLELSDALKEAKMWNSIEEIPFIQASMADVEEKMNEIELLDTPSVKQAISNSTLLLAAAKEAKTNATFNAAQDSTEQDAPHKASKLADDRNKEEVIVPEAYNQRQAQLGDDGFNGVPIHTPLPTVQHSPTRVSSEFYFYQAADGQRIYLHPLDVRILKHEFGDYKNFPQHLRMKVLGVEESSLTEEIRKRFKYLGYLPLACDVTFLEIDLGPIVSPETFKMFSNELHQRVKKRKERLKREEKEKKKAEKKMAKSHANEQQRRIISGDSFFDTDASQVIEANALAEAIRRSATEAQEKAIAVQSGPKTVWGTPAVRTQESSAGANEGPVEWAEHIVIKTKKPKKKGKK